MWRQMERKGWSVAVGRMVEPAKEQNPKRGGRLLLKKDGFRVSFFFLCDVVKIAPP
jgi:hypothetical protein